MRATTGLCFLHFQPSVLAWNLCHTALLFHVWCVFVIVFDAKIFHVDPISGTPGATAPSTIYTPICSPPFLRL